MGFFHKERSPIDQLEYTSAILTMAIADAIKAVEKSINKNVDASDALNRQVEIRTEAASHEKEAV